MPALPAPHRLRRLRWQAQAPDAAQALALRTLLRGQGDAVQQVLEQALDEAAAALGLPPDTVVHLPRLDLALPAPPALNAVHTAHTAPEQAAAWSQWLQQLQQAVQMHVQVLAQQQPSVAALRGGAAPARVQAPALHGREALRGYLRSGWPGWVLAGVEHARPGLEAAARALADDWVDDDSQGLTDARLRALWAWAGCSPGAQALGVLTRWLALLPEVRRTRWVQTKAASRLALPLGAGTGAATRAALLQGWQAEAASGRSLWAQALWLAWPDAPAEPGPWLAALEAATGPETRPPEALMRLQVALRAQRPPGPGDAGDAVGRDTCDPTTPPSRADAAPSGRPLDHPLPPPAADTTDADHLVVPLAGLVLLHPYLARLLQGLHLHSGQVGEPLAPAVLPRALALLHALACGVSEAAPLELDLPLAKLLLGLQPTQGLALPPAMLDEADQAEVQALLQAVRHHWPALRGSSVQTLQLSFLQRRGLLRRVDAQQAGAGWQLQVHSESFDLLLASLPWALQWVRLPWMPQPLAVDWPIPL